VLLPGKPYVVTDRANHYGKPPWKIAQDGLLQGHHIPRRSLPNIAFFDLSEVVSARIALVLARLMYAVEQCTAEANVPLSNE
jgi:hypothetical protein